MKKIVGLLLCLMLLVLPVTALAAGDGLGDFVGPDVGIGMTLIVVSMLIALDTILGIFYGLKKREFHWDLLPQFLATGILPYIGGLAVLAAMAYYIAEPFSAMYYAAAAAIAAKYLADIWEKLQLLFGARQPGV